MGKKLDKTQLLEFVKKHKIYFVLGIASFFLFLSGIWEYFYIFSIAICVAFYIFASKEDIICMTLFSFFFSGIKVFFMTCFISGFVFLWVKYIIDVVKKRNVIHKLPLTLTLVLILFSGIVGLFYNDYGFSALENGFLIMWILLFVYFMFSCYREISITRCLKFMMIGLSLSLVYGLISLLIPNYLIELSVFDGEFSRLKLFTYHINHLSMLCLFLISFLIYQIANRRGHLWVNILFIVIALGTGLFTISKAFIIVCVGFVGYVIIYLIIHFKAKSLRVIVPIVVLGAIMCVIFRGFVTDIFERFFFYISDSTSIIGSITTGRSGIWQTYVDAFRSSVPRMLFGSGLFVNELVDIGPHNVYLYILNHFGIVGIIGILILIYSYFRCSTVKLKPKYSNILPFLTFFVLTLEEMILSERFGIFLIFSIMIVLENHDEYERPKNEDEYEKVTKILNKDILKN